LGKLNKDIQNIEKKEREFCDAYSDLNRDGLPVGQRLVGVTKGIGYVLTVTPDSYFVAGKGEFPSLSAAAEAVSGVRRSGWTFWKIMGGGGKTVKEAYRD
jgi:hypothetical protein